MPNGALRWFQIYDAPSLLSPAKLNLDSKVNTARAYLLTSLQLYSGRGRSIQPLQLCTPRADGRPPLTRAYESSVDAGDEESSRPA